MKAVIATLPRERECIGTLNKEGVTPLVDDGQAIDDVCAKLQVRGYVV